MFHYWAYGLRIASEIELPELLPHEAEQVNCEIRVGKAPEKLTGPDIVDKGKIQISPTEFLLDLPNCRYYSRAGKEIILEIKDKLDDKSLRLFLLTNGLAAILHQRNKVLLHAGAIHTEKGLVVICGQSGAGKSTTLEIMETLRLKSSGEVNIAGFDLDRQPDEIKKIIGVQLQTSGFYPGLKLVELIDLFSGLYNRKVDPMELLSKVNLEEKAKSLYKSLSGGQKQRFSIATTLINDPRIIFLDEPTTGLDPQARRNLWDLIKNIRALGTTVIITTHYMDEAEYLCDRVAIMDAGRIISLDHPDRLIDQLIASGFEKKKESKGANLEDVFIQMTGRVLRED